ncbi:Leucine-rich repeat and immunoglobulin-like domain-containing nogo receptor-interacting protein 2 [Holothuria leucospilota]|uniref:Leucine-rich repeat and immunoglobulin-like domain-containing nogo receptor-interacting protein 2 n=1 Tax=Holothuria leucospilota TaxID=206669 RepID=A0A9Q1HK25_HOLLE|nr:Leucine-rich repeat and immunoglobulin-like domain-containing nogo receptor-interacting protein 2 [Holothuria leucospilota]
MSWVKLHNALNDCHSLQRFEQYQFRCGPRDLSENNIVNLDKDTFNNLCNLTELDLSENRIAKLAKDTFSNLWNLKKLDLRENRIVNLEKDTFRDLRLLKDFAIRWKQRFTYMLHWLEYVDQNNRHFPALRPVTTSLAMSNPWRI